MGVDDALDEVDETVKLKLTRPVNATVGPVSAAYTIRATIRQTVAFAMADVTSGERSGTVLITVRLSAAAAFPVRSRTLDSGTALVGRTSTWPGHAEVPARRDEKTIWSGLDDESDEPAEVVYIRLSGPISAALGPIDWLTLTLRTTIEGRNGPQPRRTGVGRPRGRERTPPRLQDLIL